MKNDFDKEVEKRLTFAIISHPDAGKTTLTEKFLLFGGAIQLAGTVKGRKAARHATSDWLKIEKERGISVTTSVMQFCYHDRVFNLLDTPGHEDFSEDTYRTLTAVDSALMVMDAVKGVESRTIKLAEVCRMRDTPVMTFINKLDRDSRPALDLLDEIEKVLNIACAPITWPIGMGKFFKGVYHLIEDRIYLYQSGKNDRVQEGLIIEGLDNPELSHYIGEDLAAELKMEIALVKGASHSFDKALYLSGKLSPVFFGSAMNNFGINLLLDFFADYGPSPKAHLAAEREVKATENKFTGFVFKIQANMDPMHRDRIAFLRICSGEYKAGMKLLQCRTNKSLQINQALTFMAGDREQADTAYAGDIIGLHNHGSIQIGDTFTQGEYLKFLGIPYFAPELFRMVRLKDPLKSKALLKGLTQLSEEGATQLFRPLNNNNLILGAVGVLQFDVVAYRLQAEYNVACIYEPVTIAVARWVQCEDAKILEDFKQKCADYLAWDGAEHLSYLAPSRVNLSLTMERWPRIKFTDIRELG